MRYLTFRWTSKNIRWISTLFGIRLGSCCETRDIVLDDDMSWISNVRLASKYGWTLISETFPALSRTATVQTNSASHFGKRAHVRGGKLKKNEKKIEGAWLWPTDDFSRRISAIFFYFPPPCLEGYWSLIETHSMHFAPASDTTSHRGY